MGVVAMFSQTLLTQIFKKFNDVVLYEPDFHHFVFLNCSYIVLKE